MAKLFPPALDIKLPAFTGTTLEFPFTQNRSVSMSGVSQMSVIIKTVQTNSVITDGLTGLWNYDESTGQYSASFDITDLYSDTAAAKKISPGQYYKVQLAYIGSDDVVGYYSSVATIKCTTAPKVEILNVNENYYGACDYTGYYGQINDNSDKTEKVYSYRFYIQDPDGNILASSGEQIHDSSKDDSTDSSTDIWSVNASLPPDEQHYVIYEVTTLNGLVASSQSYSIIQQDSVDLDLPCQLVATPDFEDGCISVSLRPTKQSILNGSFILSRSSSEDDYSTWNEIYRFSYQGVEMNPRATDTHPSEWNVNDILLWEDFTTQQGISYRYSLQAHNSKSFYSNRLLNVEEYLDDAYSLNPDMLGSYHTVFKNKDIYMDFEDMFLFDGERQLRIRFNPKVTSFKSTILESKMDTLGGKYPFIFRNGNVEYKEFPISGLLSLVGDPHERFLKGIQKNVYLSRADSALAESDYALDSWLTGDNLRREREFKMSALKWLTNGKPKLFRSPTEGNFIVRLMNTSFSPNDTLGRMLHSFSSTAYEIAEYTFANLNYYNFIRSEVKDNRDFKIGQIKLSTSRTKIKPPVKKTTKGIFQLPDAYFVEFTEATPGTIIGMNFSDKAGWQEYEIGATGCYIVPFRGDKPLKYVKLIKGSWDDAKLTFCYYDSVPSDNFNEISDILPHDEIRQFIGTGYPADNATEANRESLNVINGLSDIRTQIGKFHYLKIMKRPLLTCYDQGSSIYTLDKEGHDPLQGTDWNATVIYEVRNPNTNKIKGYMYGKKETLKSAKPDYRFSFNGSSVIDMEGNPNALDIFICRECQKMGVQSTFFQYDDNNVVVTDEWDDPILMCPEVHSRRTNIQRLPATHGRIDNLRNIENITTMYIGNGVIVDAAFRVKEIEYAVDEENGDVSQAKDAWKAAKETWVANKTATNKTAMNNAYEAYITKLTAVLKALRNS